MNWREKPALKIIGGIVLTLLLGALGSGLWHVALYPSFSWVIESTVRLFSSISSTYKDSIYKEAARGFHEIHSLYLYVIVLAVLLAVYLSLLMRHPWMKEKKGDSRLRRFIRSGKGFAVLVVLTCSVFVTVFSGSFRASYSNRIATRSLNNIEILSPYVEPVTTASLKSDFHRVSGSEDFNRFQERLKKIADEVNAPIVLMKPL